MAAATPSLSWEPSRTRAFVVSVTGLCKAPSPCADEFVKVLQARGVSQVRCLKDSAATRSAVEASFKSFVSACQDPDETLIFLYCGPGDNSRRTLSFPLFDSQAAGPLHNRYIFCVLEKYYKGKRALLFADCSYSGYLPPEAMKRAGRLQYGVMSSCADSSTSATEKWTFTKTLCEGFSGQLECDLNGDGILLFRELALWQEARMAEEALQLSMHVMVNGFPPDLVLAKSKPHARRPLPASTSPVFPAGSQVLVKCKGNQPALVLSSRLGLHYVLLGETTGEFGNWGGFSCAYLPEWIPGIELTLVSSPPGSIPSRHNARSGPSTDQPAVWDPARTRMFSLIGMREVVAHAMIGLEPLAAALKARGVEDSKMMCLQAPKWEVLKKSFIDFVTACDDPEETIIINVLSHGGTSFDREENSEKGKGWNLSGLLDTLGFGLDAGEGVAMSFFLNVLERHYKGRRALMFVVSCFSGHGPLEAMKHAGRLEYGVISAGVAEQGENLSPDFFIMIAEAFGGKLELDMNGDGRLLFSEMCEYMEPRQVGNSGGFSMSWSNFSAGDLVLATSKPHAPQSPPEFSWPGYHMYPPGTRLHMLANPNLVFTPDPEGLEVVSAVVLANRMGINFVSAGTGEFAGNEWGDRFGHADWWSLKGLEELPFFFLDDGKQGWVVMFGSFENRHVGPWGLEFIEVGGMIRASEGQPNATSLGDLALHGKAQAVWRKGKDQRYGQDFYQCKVLNIIERTYDHSNGSYGRSKAAAASSSFPVPVPSASHATAAAGVWYAGPAAYRFNLLRGNTKYARFFSPGFLLCHPLYMYAITDREVKIESGLFNRTTEVILWSAVKDVAFRNTCGMRCVCACGAGEIQLFCTGDASTGGLCSLYVPDARRLFDKICGRIARGNGREETAIFQGDAATGCCGCCQNGGKYKIFNTHLEIEYWRRDAATLCGLLSTHQIDFNDIAAIDDLSRTDTCCTGNYISIFVKDTSTVYNSTHNKASQSAQARADMAAYQAAAVEYRLFIDKGQIDVVFSKLDSLVKSRKASASVASAGAAASRV